MPALLRPLAAVLVVSVTLAVAACVPYNPQPGQQSYVYSPVPGGGGH